ncbi:MAG: nitroreductase family protein [Candidatus Brocadiae bacterium]|nr:nitroreductase family protein [Candidatus Brocadiia bacterium]
MDSPTIPLPFDRLPEPEMRRRGAARLAETLRRRSVRDFSPDPVPRDLIEIAIRAAASAPSGANRQPWVFVAVSKAEVKHEIRVAAEAEERESYEGGRMPGDWKEALAPLGTDWHKPFLESVPWLVAVFAEQHGVNPDGTMRRNWYVAESVGIACGLFIDALHGMGLATLTHTPSPMKFLNRILGRPANEKPYILFPVGYPAPECRVPDIRRKPVGDVLVWIE